MPRPKSSKSIALEIERSFKANMKLLEESMAGLEVNTRAYLDRLIAKAKLEQNYRDERSRRGLDPENLGVLNKIEFSFVATIDESVTKPDAKRQEFEDVLNAEFPS